MDGTAEYIFWSTNASQLKDMKHETRIDPGKSEEHDVGS